MRVKRRQQAEIVPQRSSSEMIIQRMGVTVDDRLEQTRRLYERAVFGGDASGLAEADRYLSAVEADLALARRRVLHARFLDATVIGGYLQRSTATAQKRSRRV